MGRGFRVLLTAVVLTLTLLAPGIAVADGEAVPGSLTDWGCHTVQSALDGLPPGTDYIVANLETGDVRSTLRTFRDASSGEWQKTGLLGPGFMIHQILQTRTQEDPRIQRIVSHKAVNSRSDCNRSQFFTHDNYEIEVRRFSLWTAPEIHYRMFFSPKVVDTHRPGRAGPHFAIFLDDVTVGIDALTDQREDQDAIRQEIWNNRERIEAQCCAPHSGEFASELGVISYINDTLDSYNVRIAGWRLAGEQEIVLILEPQVAPCVPGKYYTIVNKSSGKVLGVAGGSLNDGAPVVQWERDGTNNQKWSCMGAPEGYSTIVAAHSGKLLNVAEASPADGGRVIQWPRGNADNERWRFEEAGDGYYNLVAKHSGKLLGVAAGSRDRGAPVVQWRRDGTDNQAWRLEETMAPVR